MSQNCPDAHSIKSARKGQVPGLAAISVGPTVEDLCDLADVATCADEMELNSIELTCYSCSHNLPHTFQGCQSSTVLFAELHHSTAPPRPRKKACFENEPAVWELLGSPFGECNFPKGDLPYIHPSLETITLPQGAHGWLGPSIPN